LLQGDQQVERLRPGQGVPVFTRLGVTGGALVLETESRLLRFDLEHLNRVVLAVPDWQPALIEPLPAVLQPGLQAASVPASLNWQRLLQDLHAGRVFGWAGQWVMDLAALLLVVLALTGVVIWSRSR
jgi:hypothetical protein